MSTIFTARYLFDDFEVEITREGNLLFLDYDVQYDVVMAEFGEPETVAVMLLEEWKDDPLDVICRRLGLEKQPLIYLAADWAEHVLPEFQDYDKDDKRPEEAIKIARKCAEEIGTPEEGKAIAATEAAHNARMAAENARDWASRSAAASAATSAFWAAKAAAEIFYSKPQSIVYVSDAARAAQRAAARAHAGRREAARLAELAWQIRRFVDCMEAVQSGKPWPPLGATP